MSGERFDLIVLGAGSAARWKDSIRRDQASWVGLLGDQYGIERGEATFLDPTRFASTDASSPPSGS